MGASGRSEGDAEGAVVGAVRALVVELHPYEPPAVRLDSDLERDLGLDSLALAELLVRLGRPLRRESAHRAAPHASSGHHRRHPWHATR